MSDDKMTIDEMREMGPLRIARMVGIHAPDSYESPGGEWLTSVRDATVDTLAEMAPGEIFLYSRRAELAENCVETYGMRRWRIFTELRLYYEDREVLRSDNIDAYAHAIAADVARRIIDALCDRMDRTDTADSPIPAAVIGTDEQAATLDMAARIFIQILWDVDSNFGHGDGHWLTHLSNNSGEQALTDMRNCTPCIRRYRAYLRGDGVRHHMAYVTTWYDTMTSTILAGGEDGRPFTEAELQLLHVSLVNNANNEPYDLEWCSSGIQDHLHKVWPTTRDHFLNRGLMCANHYWHASPTSNHRAGWTQVCRSECHETRDIRLSFN